MQIQKKTFKAKLPATPCDEEMRARMKERAAAMGVSLAEAQRNAFAVFLGENVTEFVKKS